MIAKMGTYQNGYVKLDQEYLSEKPVKVIITFLEDVDVSSENRLTMNDFSFLKSRKALESYTGSFSDTVIEERQNDL